MATTTTRDAVRVYRRVARWLPRVLKGEAEMESAIARAKVRNEFRQPLTPERAAAVATLLRMPTKQLVENMFWSWRDWKRTQASGGFRFFVWEPTSAAATPPRT